MRLPWYGLAAVTGEYYLAEVGYVAALGEGDTSSGEAEEVAAASAADVSAERVVSIDDYRRVTVSIYKIVSECSEYYSCVCERSGHC